MNSVSLFTKPHIRQEIFESGIPIPEIWEIILNYLLQWSHTRAVVQFACTCHEARDIVVNFLKNYRERKASAFRDSAFSPNTVSVTEAGEWCKRMQFAGKDSKGRFYFLHEAHHINPIGTVYATGLVTTYSRKTTQLGYYHPKYFLQNEELEIQDVHVKAIVPFVDGACYLTSKGICLLNKSGHHVIPSPIDDYSLKGHACLDNILFFMHEDKQSGLLECYELDLLASNPLLIKSTRFENYLSSLLPKKLFPERKSCNLRFSFYSTGSTLFIVSQEQIIEAAFQADQFKTIECYAIPKTLCRPVFSEQLLHHANHSWLACCQDGKLIVFDRKDFRCILQTPIHRVYAHYHAYFQLQDDFLWVAENNLLKIIHLPSRQMYTHEFTEKSVIAHAWLDFQFHDHSLSLHALVLNPLYGKDDWHIDKCSFHTITFTQATDKPSSRFTTLPAPDEQDAVVEETVEEKSDYIPPRASFPKKNTTIEKVAMAVGAFFLLASLAAFSALLITHTGTFIQTALPVLLGGGIPSLLAIIIASVRWHQKNKS